MNEVIYLTRGPNNHLAVSLSNQKFSSYFEVLGPRPDYSMTKGAYKPFDSSVVRIDPDFKEESVDYYDTDVPLQRYQFVIKV